VGTFASSLSQTRVEVIERFAAPMPLTREVSPRRPYAKLANDADVVLGALVLIDGSVGIDVACSRVWRCVRYRIVFGDVLDQPVDVIVNAWNRNVIPWWLLLPQGVSGAIKKRGGNAPFRELGQLGAITLGGAVLTGAGRLRFRGIIHVAGINMLWRASEQSIRLSVRNACALAERERFATLALPAIGAGSGGFDEALAVALISDELDRLSHDLDVIVVRYRKERSGEVAIVAA
jgi:O-acetyl-ADP-ribose deacetylase (regulator of RNase III)